MSRDMGAEERSLPQLLSDMTTELATLMRKELQLARVETKEEVTKAGKAGGLFAGAGLAAYMALLLFSFAAAWGLANIMPTGLAFLLVGVVYVVVAAVLYAQARKALKQVSPVPEQTVETLKEDVEWAKARKR